MATPTEAEVLDLHRRLLGDEIAHGRAQLARLVDVRDSYPNFIGQCVEHPEMIGLTFGSDPIRAWVLIDTERSELIVQGDRRSDGIETWTWIPILLTPDSFDEA
jgi:hypothetical protein